MTLYLLKNGPMQTTAAFAGVTTGTAIKTMLQVKLGATLVTSRAKIVEWGCSFNGSAAATPGKVELITTGSIKATITEFVAADITNLEDPNAAANTDDNPFAYGAAGDESGYTASAEGSITAVRSLAGPQYIAPTTQYSWQFPLGREPVFRYDEYMRIRMHFGAAVDAACYVIIEV